MTTLEMCAYGIAGALVPDLIRIAKFRTMENGDFKYLADWRYFVSLAAHIALGLLAVKLGAAKDPVQAAAYGFAAPELIAKMLSKPAGSGFRSLAAPAFDLRDWLSR